MLGDQRRRAVADALLRVRRAREQSFSSQLFAEHAWVMLVHLFCAMAANETISEERLIQRSGAPLSVGRSWLKHLAADGQIVAREGGEVEMTEAAIAGMRSFLDAAVVIGKKIDDGD